MGKSVFRYLLIVAVLILLFGVGTKGFSYALSDAYNALIGNGWTAKDALGFLGTSIAGTLAMNPSLAPAAAAGALSAYIVYKGAQLYDIYRDWKNLRTGIAILNPVEYSENMAVGKVRNGESGWSRIHFHCNYYWWEPHKCEFAIVYNEYYNNNGTLVLKIKTDGYYGAKKSEVIGYINGWLAYQGPDMQDPKGKAGMNAVLQTGYNYVAAGRSYSVEYTREVVPALETGSTSVNAATLGYRVNVDPASISEDGVNYLNDADAFYNWFVTNYMNGVNEGTFVTPTVEAYDEIRTQLDTIITQLNNLSSVGGVSSETLEQFKTDIINTINTKVGALESSLNSTLTSLLNSVNTLQTDIDTEFDSLESAITGVNTSLNALEDDIGAVKTSIDTLTSGISEAQEQEQGFWDRLMEWLDVTLWEKLRELLEELFVPTQEQLDELFDIQVPEYEQNFAAEVSITSQSASIPISLFGSSVDLAGYISQYASGLRTFMDIFVSGLAALFVIHAFRVHLNID